MLTDEQRSVLLDIIGDADACSDRECGCKFSAGLAQSILDGQENYEVIDGD